MRTWITDENGNRASVEYWGSEEAARKSLETLTRCSDCSDCSDCSRCSDCSDCSRCSHVAQACDHEKVDALGAGWRGPPPVPVIENIDIKVYETASRSPLASGQKS